MKRFWLKNGLIYFDPLNSEIREIGELKEADIQDGVLILGNMAIPLDKDDEVYVEWNKLYPNGKAVEEVHSKPQIDPIEGLILENLELAEKINELQKVAEQLTYTQLSV